MELDVILSSIFSNILSGRATKTERDPDGIHYAETVIEILFGHSYSKLSYAGRTPDEEKQNLTPIARVHEKNLLIAKEKGLVAKYKAERLAKYLINLLPEEFR